MKIEAVKMMHSIRDQMSLDIKGMTFEEEQDYLRSRIKIFEHLIEIKSDKKLQPTTQGRTRSACAVLGSRTRHNSAMLKNRKGAKEGDG